MSEHDQPIEGWRAWRITVGGLQLGDHGWRSDGQTPGLRLRSWTRGDEWPPRKPMDALAANPTCDPATHPGALWRTSCRCGVYAYKSETRCIQDLADERMAPLTYLLAVGRVSLWGRYVEAEHGWRARYGYPYEISVYNAADRGIARALAATYAIDVEHGGPFDPFQLAGRGRDCARDGHLWQHQACAACGASATDFLHAQFVALHARSHPRVRSAVGAPPPPFPDREELQRWFLRVGDRLNLLLRGRNTDLAEESRRLVTAALDWLHAFPPVEPPTHRGVVFRDPNTGTIGAGASCGLYQMNANFRLPSGGTWQTVKGNWLP